MRIVVIDDDPLFLRLIQKAFEVASAEVVVLLAQGYTRGIEVLQQLASLGLAPGLVVVDSSLGDGTGLDLLQVLRQDAGLASVPAVLVSAYLDSSADEAARRCGAVACFEKPAGFDRLVELATQLNLLARASD